MSSEDVSIFHKEIIEGLATLKQVTSDILLQTTKTNGRVSKLEETVATHSAKMLLTDAADAAALLKANWWKDNIGKALISILFAVIGAAVLLVLQKTDILDISVVSGADYEAIDSITSAYEGDTQ